MKRTLGEHRGIYSSVGSKKKRYDVKVRLCLAIGRLLLMLSLAQQAEQPFQVKSTHDSTFDADDSAVSQLLLALHAIVISTTSSLANCMSFAKIHLCDHVQS